MQNNDSVATRSLFTGFPHCWFSYIDQVRSWVRVSICIGHCGVMHTSFTPQLLFSSAHVPFCHSLCQGCRYSSILTGESCSPVLKHRVIYSRNLEVIPHCPFGEMLALHWLEYKVAALCFPHTIVATSQVPPGWCLISSLLLKSNYLFLLPLLLSSIISLFYRPISSSVSQQSVRFWCSLRGLRPLPAH